MDIWINIAAIIIPSIVAILIGRWQIKTMRALANPEVKPQKKRKKFTDLIDALTSTVRRRISLALLSMLPLVVGLCMEFFIPHTFTKSCIFAINIAFAMITIQIALITTLEIARLLLTRILKLESRAKKT